MITIPLIRIYLIIQQWWWFSYIFVCMYVCRWRSKAWVESIMEVKCMFKFRYGSVCDNSKPCTSKGQAGINSIIKASKSVQWWSSCWTWTTNSRGWTLNSILSQELCFAIHIINKYRQTCLRPSCQLPSGQEILSFSNIIWFFLSVPVLWR